MARVESPIKRLLPVINVFHLSYFMNFIFGGLKKSFYIVNNFIRFKVFIFNFVLIFYSLHNKILTLYFIYRINVFIFGVKSYIDFQYQKKNYIMKYILHIQANCLHS